MICLDTSPVIWAVQSPDKESSDPIVARTVHYLRRAGETGESLAIPAPVLFEYLVGLPVDRHSESRRAIEANFLVPAFDTKAACIAAAIQADRERFRAADHRNHTANRQIRCCGPRNRYLLWGNRTLHQRPALARLGEQPDQDRLGSGCRAAHTDFAVPRCE